MIDYSSTYFLTGLLAAYLVLILIAAWCISNADEYDGDDF